MRVGRGERGERREEREMKEIKGKKNDEEYKWVAFGHEKYGG